MKLKYDGRIELQDVFDRKQFKQACKDSQDKENSHCLLNCSIPHIKRDQKILEKWLLNNAMVYLFSIPNKDIPDPRQIVMRCKICNTKHRDIRWHVEKRHSVEQWKQTVLQELAYKQIMIPLLRSGIWQCYFVLRHGCPLCYKESLKTLEDGTQHKWPWRCVRFEITRNKAWHPNVFGLDWEGDVETVKTRSVAIVIDKEDVRCVDQFVKKFR